MFCTNCGNKLDDNVKFCTNCGAAVSAQPKTAPAPEPVKPVNVYAPTPVQPKNKKKNPLKRILPIVLAVVLLIGAVLLLFVTGVFASDKGKVAKAFTKSALEYMEVFDAIALPNQAEKGEEIATSQSIDVKIQDLPYMPELEGLGAQIALDADFAGRQVGLTVTPSYGSADILDAKILFQDATVFATVPQLVGDRVYMVNTENLGAALINFGANEEAKDFGFNIFDVVELVKNATKVDEEDLDKVKEATKELAKAIEAEKAGKETIDVNESTLKCDAYEVVIPEDALKDLIKTLEDLSGNVDPVQLCIDLFESMGLPDYLIEEMVMEMDIVDFYGEAYDMIYDLLDELGDIELTVYLHKGYVASVYYEFSIMETDFELTVQLGGGENYTDDLRMEFVIEDVAEILLESHGDHTSPKGIFTDETTAQISIVGDETITVSSELTYEPDGKDENFLWTLDADVAKVSISGQITTDKESVAFEMNNIDVWSYDEKVLGISLNVNIGEYNEPSLSTKDAMEILHLSEEELNEELALVGETVMQWAISLSESSPALVELLDSIM